MDNITVSDLEMNDPGLSLSVSWLPPTKPFGEIQQYQVRVGVVPLSSEEQEGSITRSSHVNFHHELQNATSIELTTEEFYVDDETLCLYVQVRCYLPCNILKNQQFLTFLHRSAHKISTYGVTGVNQGLSLEMDQSYPTALIKVCLA